MAQSILHSGLLDTLRGRKYRLLANTMSPSLRGSNGQCGEGLAKR